VAMNSKQRRKTERAHPHHITIYAQPNEIYLEHDIKVVKAFEWCKKKCKGHVARIYFHDKAIFKFSNQKDAMHFALKWL
jgi:hypothetical protein